METYGLEQLGSISPSAVYRNLSPAILVEKALARGEGKLNSTGALCVNTGKYTGRSPNDKFIVDSAGVHDEIAWGKVNVPTTQEVFDAVYEKMVAYLQSWPARTFSSTSFCCVPRKRRVPITSLTSPSSAPPALSASLSGTM